MNTSHSIAHLNFFVDNATLIGNSVDFAIKVKPEWKDLEIKTKIFTDGITNRLVGCYIDSNPDDIILVRIHGEKTELFIDRQTELRNMILMNKAGISPPIYFSFINGICYGFTPGNVLDEKSVRDPKISLYISQMMAEMHSIKLADYPNLSSRLDLGLDDPCLFRILRRYLSLIPSAFQEKQQNKIFQALANKDKLEKEINVLEKHLKSLKSPVVFCHNDLLLKNIILNKSKKSVTFIDFEYADFNYQAFDIGNHFCEFAGVDTFDGTLYPEKEFQVQWIRNYLITWYNLNNTSYSMLENSDLDQKVDELYVHVNKFSLASHLLWSLWAFLQAEHSSLNFNYFGYACQRIQEYYSKKDDFLSMEVLPKNEPQDHYF